MDKKIERVLSEVDKLKEIRGCSLAFYEKTNNDYGELYSEYKGNKERNNYQDFIKAANNYLKINNNDSEFVFMSGYYNIFRGVKNEDIEKKEIELLSSNLQSLFESMNMSGIIEIILNRYNDKCERLDVDCLKVSNQQIMDEFDYKRNLREKLPVLYLKNAFWLNKYQNILDKLCIQKLLEQNIGDNYNGSDNLDFLLYMNMRKYKILKQIYRRELTSNPDEDIASSLCEEYGQAYENVFRDIFPQEGGRKNNIHEDYNNYREYQTVIQNILQKRNVLLNILLKNQMTQMKVLNPAIRDWGINLNQEQAKVYFRLQPCGYILPAAFTISEPVYKDAIKSFGLDKYTFPVLNTPNINDESRKIFLSSMLVKPTAEQLKQIKLQSKQPGEHKEFFKSVLNQCTGKVNSYVTSDAIELEI